MPSTELPSVDDALNEYFKLKQKFEDESRALKRQILNNTSLSKKEKRAEFLKLMPKCVNCKRPSKKGTLFSVVFHPSNDTSGAYKTFSASCGNIAEPCNLAIEVEMGQVEPLDKLMADIREEIRVYKNAIINDKNKLLFGLITTEQALEHFDLNKGYVSELTSIYELYLEQWNQIVDNPVRAQELRETLLVIHLNVQRIQECMKKRAELDDPKFASDAAEIYITTLKPLLDKARNLKYTINDVYFDDYYNVRRLIQRPYTEIDLGITAHTHSVVKFDVGLQAMAPAPRQQRHAMADDDYDEWDDEEEYEDKNRPTTSSNSIVIDIRPQAQAQAQAKAPAPMAREIPRDEPVVGKDDIAWRVPEYKQLWAKLPSKLKTEFKLNLPWMKDFMHKCVNARQSEGSRFAGCRLSAPPNLTVPPKSIGKDSYNFGVPVYTRVFNKQPKTVQETYLALYKEDPSTKVKDYSMMVEAVTKLVENELQFGDGMFV